MQIIEHFLYRMASFVMSSNLTNHCEKSYKVTMRLLLHVGVLIVLLSLLIFPATVFADG